ncbi:hypothetical protein [Mycobacterium sp. SMC-4]|uniref:hypothetical protein n=1 Tax=Mycobacterium sp. SMC-4 TaxID=2857059 RepID=UPI0021B2141D|nr:hypothetical protein [Mycobacterium sp. SMC-4]UXA16109.1 hypothetical protein KXD98_14740 [Mycobacterium sp. SMC-4]
MSTDDVGGTTANDLGGAEDMLSPMESTDPDDIRNADGDEVVDPPEDWSGADKYGMSSEEQRQGDTLDERLAEEVPDVSADGVDPGHGVDTAADSDNAVPDSEAVDPGSHQGQVGGAPEDGDPFFQVVE